MPARLRSRSSSNGIALGSCNNYFADFENYFIFLYNMVEEYGTGISTDMWLQPYAPVVSRACLILECAHLVHQCNKGHWPTWMKHNFPMFRPSVPINNRNASTALRRVHVLQRTAGKLFYQWAEVLINCIFSIKIIFDGMKYKVMIKIGNRSTLGRILSWG